MEDTLFLSSWPPPSPPPTARLSTRLPRDFGPSTVDLAHNALDVHHLLLFLSLPQSLVPLLSALRSGAAAPARPVPRLSCQILSTTKRLPTTITMKSAKPPVADTASHRRSQPVRQTRTNPPRSSAIVARPSGASLGAGPVGDQPIDIFPAITHFADAMTALPKELVRHFTLLKEVDAKIFAPEEHLFKLVDAATKAPMPEPRTNNEPTDTIAPASAPMSAQGSSSGLAVNTGAQSAPSAAGSQNASSAVFDAANIPRRQLFRQTALKIQEMLVSLEEKNHVILTANDALHRQLARVDDVWPHIENEFSDEAKWGSVTHWAYPENRTGRASHAERARRDGAAAISAAAQALAEEAAARSDARKQAVQAKKNLKNSHLEADFDDHDGRPKAEGAKKSQGKSRKAADSNVGLGISASATKDPPQKRRKVEKVINGGVPMDRAMSSVYGSTAAKAKASSPRETPAPEGPKKRKALPSGSGQSKKRYESSTAIALARDTNRSTCSKNGAAGATLSATASPIIASLPEPKAPARASPAPSVVSRPASSRARGNSIHSNAENGKVRAPPPPPPASVPNGKATGTPELAPTNNWPRAGTEPKQAKETTVPVKTEPAKKELERAESSTAPAPPEEKKEAAPPTERERRKSESVPLNTHGMPTVTTKSGRASKPSTPALATFQEAARSRSARNAEGGNNNNGHRKHQKKNSTVSISAIPRAAEVAANHPGPVDEEGDIDADEPTYCYCNSVSYGEMVACDADTCAREWFHLACVGLKVAPGSKSEHASYIYVDTGRKLNPTAKWYCEDCKERLKMGGKKVNGR